MERYGLIGHPIAHSQSPRLFQAAYGGKYPYDLIQTPLFEEAFERFLSGYEAVNVTAPFKLEAFRKADLHSPECLLTGAANILLKTPGGIKAYNSDYLGLRWLLQREGPFENVLVVGYGGAGRAAQMAACSLGHPVTVVNRSTQKGEGVQPLSVIGQREWDLVIYTLPVDIPETAALRCGRLLEANYRDPVLKGRIPPQRYVGGERWLLSQALCGYALMTGIEPDGKALEEAVSGLTVPNNENK